ncbi:MAG: hypothetical protein H8D82_00950 [Euryarchaeota archaeon]|nr:hypothetical protein [Euryarchaeota archaeon]
MQQSVRWLIALLLALMLALPVSVVASGGDDDENDDDSDNDANDSENEDGDEREDRVKHDVDVDISGDEIKVELKREIGHDETKIEFKVDLSEAKFKLKFEEETGQLETEQKLEVVMQRLFEYVDANGNGAYDEGEVIASGYRIGDSGDSLSDSPDNGSVDWGQPTLSDITTGGISGKAMSARGTFGAESEGVFGLDIKVYGDFTMLNGSQLLPTEVKIDFIIENYPYTQNDSVLGLLLKTKTKQEQDRQNSDIDNNEEGVVATSSTDANAVSLGFAWKQTATVDGVDMPVHTTVMKSETETSEDEFEFKQRFVLGYARGDVIVHDPVAGVSYASAASAAVEEGKWYNLPGFGVLATLTAFIGTAFLVRPRTVNRINDSDIVLDSLGSVVQQS